MCINDTLEHAYEVHIGMLLRSFIDSVAGAKNKENEMIAAAERFKVGANLAKEVLVKAKLVIED
jgi:hypothetical protein